MNFFNIFRKNKPNKKPKQFGYIEPAGDKLMEWASLEKIKIARIDYVVPFVPEDKSVVVYIFFDSDETVCHYNKNGTTELVKTKYLDILEELMYPGSYLAQVDFVIDSKENVDKNYEGSYFFRLR